MSHDMPRSYPHDHDLFPPTKSFIVTDNPSLTVILMKIASKVNAKVLLPWSTLQRSHLYTDTTSGIRSPAELDSALLRFNVSLSPSELLLVYASFPVADGSGRCDFRRLVATMFPTDRGMLVAPRYKGTGTNSVMHELARGGKPDEARRQQNSIVHRGADAQEALYMTQQYIPREYHAADDMTKFTPSNYHDYNNQHHHHHRHHQPIENDVVRSTNMATHTTSNIYGTSVTTPYAWSSTAPQLDSFAPSSLSSSSSFSPSSSSDPRNTSHSAYRGSRTSDPISAHQRHLRDRAAAISAAVQIQRPASRSYAIIRSPTPSPTAAAYLPLPVAYRRPYDTTTPAVRVDTQLSPTHLSTSGTKRLNVASPISSHTYMLPVPHRSSSATGIRTGKHQQYYHSPSSSITSPTSIKSGIGTQSPTLGWRKDTHTISSVQFGSPMRY